MEQSGAGRPRRETGEIEAVYRLSAAVGRASDPGGIVRAAVDGLTEAIGADRASVLLFDDDGALRFKASGGLSPGYRRRVEGHTPWSPADTDARPITIPDVARDHSLGDLRDTVLDEGIRALAFIPLVAGDRLLGKLVLYYDQPHDFGKAELRFTETIANQVAFALVRREVEGAIADSDERFRHIFQAAGVSMWVEDFTPVVAQLASLPQDPDALGAHLTEHPEVLRRAIESVRIVDVNDETLQLFEAPDKASLLQSLTEVFTPATETAFLEELVALAEGRERIRSETRLRTLKGREIWVLFTVHFGPPEARDLHRVVVTLTDITLRKQAELALQEADRKKDEFLATLGHELRGPLAPLRNALSIVRRGVDASGRTAAYETMERQLDHMVGLVDDLVDISRISRGKVTLREETVDVVRIVSEAAADIGPLCQQADRQLRVSLPPEPVWVEGDAIRLSQIVGNLLSNAIKFTAPGDTVRLEVERAGDEVTIRVADTGAGISADELPAIFEMFHQSETPGPGTGLGIGLALSRQLARMHGGDVDATSAGPGEGSEFRVRLSALGDTEVNRTRVSDEPEGPREGRLGGRSILIVDDNRDAAETLAMLLELQGHDVHVAFDGLRAVEVAAHVRPDVMLIDIGMPGIDGFETARRIRKQPENREAVLIALTGYNQPEDRRRSRGAGFDAHLSKPLRSSALSEVLREHDSLHALDPNGTPA